MNALSSVPSSPISGLAMVEIGLTTEGVLPSVLCAPCTSPSPIPFIPSTGLAATDLTASTTPCPSGVSPCPSIGCGVLPIKKSSNPPTIAVY